MRGFKALRLFQQAKDVLDTYPDMTLLHYTSLLAVAAHPGIGTTEVQECVGGARSSGMRAVQDLGERRLNGKPGYKLVETMPDPTDKRRNILQLSEKGKAFVTQLTERL
ncbi:hypothetical protein [Zooshikella sp. RANM57]|uniref:hypothetical protein n=1 Tax=Zooshikella sp. RANM57 TaxID=3425863 RepID=UPI003D6F52C5